MPWPGPLDREHVARDARARRDVARAATTDRRALAYISTRSSSDGPALHAVAERRLDVAHVRDELARARRARSRTGDRGPSIARSSVKCFSSSCARRARPRPTATWMPSVWSERPTGTPNAARIVGIARRFMMCGGDGIERRALQQRDCSARPHSRRRRPRPRSRRASPCRSRGSAAGRLLAAYSDEREVDELERRDLERGDVERVELVDGLRDRTGSRRTRCRASRRASARIGCHSRGSAISSSSSCAGLAPSSPR